MTSAVISNSDRDSYIKRYNDSTSIICRPPSVITVEHLDCHSDNAQDFENSSKTDDKSSDPSLFNYQAPNDDTIFDDDFYDFREDNDGDDDDDEDDDDDDNRSSISSILEAFTNTLATPPSASWEYENEQSTTFNHPTFSSSLPVKREEDHRSLKRCSSVCQLTPRSSYYFSTVTTCPVSSLNTLSHRANKSWPNRISNSTSLPLLTHQISMNVGPNSRTSDLSTCATLVSTSPIRSAFERKPSYPDGRYTTPSKLGEYRDQIQTCGSSTPSSPGFSTESEKSSWESDDEDDDTDTINNDGTFADRVLGWPRFSRIQMPDIKRKLRIKTSNLIHEDDNINQSHGKWHEAIRKSTERKKKVSNALRGFLRIKVPTLD